MGKKQKKRKQKASQQKFNVQAEFNKAYALHNHGAFDRAEKGYHAVLKHDPNHANAFHFLGVIALEQHQYDNAIDFIKRAITIHPNMASFHNNLGWGYHNNGQYHEAEKAYKMALDIDPEYVDAHNNLGVLFKDMGDATNALENLNRAIQLNPDYSKAYYNLGLVFCDQARIPASILSYRKAIELEPSMFAAYSNLLYTLHFSDKTTPEEIFSEHQNWAALISIQQGGGQVSKTVDLDNMDKISIGYLSPDFCTHSVAFFLEDVLAAHNKNLFEIYCYSNTPKADDFTMRFKELADQWRDISLMNDDEVCQCIKKDRIDILVDLAGHTRNNRILVFAMKPAPIQVAWLGYPDTTGLDTMDYRITDEIADPKGESDRFHSEILYRLPNGFLCYRPAGEFYPVSPLPSLSTGTITFGSFNNTSKLSDTIITLWAEVLNQVSDSRLKLKSRAYSDFGTRKLILERFLKHGVTSERIWFEGYRVSLNEHFLLYGTIDIALDTFPYNGATTTCEALWMGVPVITLSGDNHVSRVGKSILTHMGLSEFIAETQDQYVQIAVKLAKNLNRLKELRCELRDRMIESPLLDSSGLTSELEKAFQFMLRQKQHEQGATAPLKPAPSGLYQKNLICIQEHHPYIEGQLKVSSGLNLKVEKTPSGLKNLIIKDRTGQWFPIYDDKNPLNDLSELLDAVKKFHGQVLCVMGAGLMHHAQAIVDLLGTTNLIVFFEAFPEIFKCAMENSDLTGVFSHHNVRLAIGEGTDPYILFYKETDKLFINAMGEFLEFNRMVSLDPDWYKTKKETFKQFFRSRKVSKDTVVHAGKKFLENAFNNLPAMADSQPIYMLKNKLRGKPAFVVAAGPSLSKNIHELKKIKDKALIVAADSAVAPLMAEGIKPHIITSVDYNDFTFEKLAPFADDLHDVSLVYIPNVTPKIVNGIRFSNKFYVFPDEDIKKIFNRLLNVDADSLEDIQSVAHLALVTTQEAGCDPIVFMGLDLSFSGKDDHAGGTILNWGNNRVHKTDCIMVEDIHGNMVPSSNGFIGMIEIFNRMIQLVPGRTYIDATEGGARIHGTLIRALSDVIKDNAMEKEDAVSLDWISKKKFTPHSVLNEMERLIHDINDLQSMIKQYRYEYNCILKIMKQKNITTLTPESSPKIIADRTFHMDKISSKVAKAPVISYLSCLMMEYFDENKRLVLDVYEKKWTPKRYMAAIKQQVLVQDARSSSADFLRKLIEDKLDIIDTLCSPSHDDSAKIEISEILYNHGYLVLAEDYLEGVEDHPGKCYVSGCIQIQRGNIEKGKALFERAVQGNPALSVCIEEFKRAQLDKWSHNELNLYTHKKLSLMYALRLDPDNLDIQIKYQAVIQNRTISLIKNNEFSMACNELLHESDNISFFSEVMHAMLSALLLSQGHVDQSRAHLKTSIEIETDSMGRLDFFIQFFDRINPSNSIFPDQGWLVPLITDSQSHDWAKRAVQELLWVQCHTCVEKIMTMQISQLDLKRFKLFVTSWENINHLMPEWYLFKACMEMHEKNMEQALASLDKALEVQKKTVPLVKRCGTLQFVTGLFLLYAEDEAGAMESMGSDPELHDNPCSKAVLAVLSIRHGEKAIADALFHDLISCGETLPWITSACELYQAGDLNDICYDYKSLNGRSFVYAIMGKCLKNCAMDKEAIRYFRVALICDSGILDTTDGQWIADQVALEWEKDIETAELFLKENRTDDAERLIGEWYQFRYDLDSYHMVMAVVLSSEGDNRKAINYLNSYKNEIADKPQVLSHLSRLLFLQGERDEACDILKKAVTLHTETAILWEEIGDVFFEENNLSMALNAYEQCLTSLPDKIDTLRKIGDVYTAMGMLESAAMAYQAVLNSNSENEIAKIRLQEIQQSTKGT